MPKLESKVVYKELGQGIVWPFYWIFGEEKWKVRDLFQKIRSLVLGGASSSLGSSFGWAESLLDGAEVTSEEVLDLALSRPLGGGVPLIVLKNAHLLKNADILAQLFGQPGAITEIASVCVCLSKDLDGRKKFSKLLLEKAAVVPCEEVPESQRESWIQFLAKQKGLKLEQNKTEQLSVVDPWSLDLMERELEKLSLSDLSEDVLLGGGRGKSEEEFLESFFTRRKAAALVAVAQISKQPDTSIMLVGLLAWNVRQMTLFLIEKEKGRGYLKLSPFLMERIQRWSRYWDLNQISQLQQLLGEMDFKMKQSKSSLLGLWTDLLLGASETCLETVRDTPAIG